MQLLGRLQIREDINSIMHLFPKTKFIPIKNGGHLFPFEETEKCINEINAILNNNDNVFALH